MFRNPQKYYVQRSLRNRTSRKIRSRVDQIFDNAVIPFGGDEFCQLMLYSATSPFKAKGETMNRRRTTCECKIICPAVINELVILLLTMTPAPC